MNDKSTVHISDPRAVRTVFVNQLVNSGHLNGVVNVTLATAQFTAQPDGSIAPDLVVAARLRMDLYVAAQLRDALDKIIAQNTEPSTLPKLALAGRNRSADH